LLEAVGNAEWTGTPLAPLLEEAGVEDDVVDLVFTGADHGLQGDVEQDYQRSLSVENAMHPDVMLAWEMNGQPLLPQHGAPLRLLVPGWYGMTSVKWLTRIEAVPDRFEGFQMLAYRKRDQADDEGIDVTRIFPRSLMIPPGFPEFFTRTRIVDAGRIELTGRAWSGWGRIVRVEVSTDGNAQPLDQSWNHHGFENNAVQRVPVTVRSGR
jgi:DMSO/TMAO reductase YedYZ molybdopterin-dependent catalytic subunit